VLTPAGEKVEVSADFTEEVDQLVDDICAVLGLESGRNYTLLRVIPDKPPKELNLWESLRNQGVIPGDQAQLILKVYLTPRHSFSP